MEFFGRKKKGDLRVEELKIMEFNFFVRVRKNSKSWIL